MNLIDQLSPRSQISRGTIIPSRRILISLSAISVFVLILATLITLFEINTLFGCRIALCILASVFIWKSTRTAPVKDLSWAELPHISWKIENGKIRFNNRMFEYTSRQPKDTFESIDAWLDHIHADDHEKVRTQFLKLSREDACEDFEIRIRNNQNEPRWHRCSFGPARQEGSVFVRYGSLIDIDETKRIQADLQVRNSEHAILSATATDLLAAHDHTEMIENTLHATTMFLECEIFMYYSHVNAKLIMRVAHGAGSEWVAFRNQLELGESIIGQSALERQERYAVSGSSELQEFLPDVNLVLTHPLVLGSELYGVVVIASRIKEQLSQSEREFVGTVGQYIIAAQERMSVMDAMRSSEGRYRMLFESNPHPMFVYSGKSRTILAVNQATIRHYGYTREQLIGSPIEFLESPTTQTQLGNTPPPRTQLKSHLTSNGSVRQMELTVTLIEFDSQPAFLMLAIDVTDRKLLEEQLKQAQKLESIGQLAAGIAHEINTPIQYIGDNTKFLNEAFQDLIKLTQSASGDLRANTDLKYYTDEVPKAVEQTLDGVEHVARIVRAMKDFAHPGTEDKALVDLNKAIETVTVVARNEWKYCAELDLQLNPKLPSVMALPGELNQVFLNLLVNAAHAVQARKDEPGYRGRIMIRSDFAGRVVEVTLSDNGCGIPEKIINRIYDPFFTTKPVGQGTGQGLSIAHAVIVKKHGGKIHCQSRLGEGTTFTVLLPIDGVPVSNTEVIHQSKVWRRVEV